MLMLPMVVMAYLVVGTLYTPVAAGRMFLYKNLNRATIINTKILALLGVYAKYVVAQTVVTFGLYALYIARFDYASGTLLPAAVTDIASDVASIAGILCAGVVTILVAAATSAKSSAPKRSVAPWPSGSPAARREGGLGSTGICLRRAVSLPPSGIPCRGHDFGCLSP